MDLELYVGPYALWLLTALPRERDEWEELWSVCDRIASNENPLSFQPPTVEIEGRLVYQYCFFPLLQKSKRNAVPDAPRSLMRILLEQGASSDSLSPNDDFVTDWTDANPSAEIKWLTQTFAEELSALEVFFGERPALRWGLLYTSFK